MDDKLCIGVTNCLPDRQYVNKLLFKSHKRTKTESTKNSESSRCDSLRLDYVAKLVVGGYHYTYIDLVFIVPDINY